VIDLLLRDLFLLCRLSLFHAPQDVRKVDYCSLLWYRCIDAGAMLKGVCCGARKRFYHVRLGSTAYGETKANKRGAQIDPDQRVLELELAQGYRYARETSSYTSESSPNRTGVSILVSCKSSMAQHCCVRHPDCGQKRKEGNGRLCLSLDSIHVWIFRIVSTRKHVSMTRNVFVRECVTFLSRDAAESFFIVLLLVPSPRRRLYQSP